MSAKPLWLEYCRMKVDQGLDGTSNDSCTNCGAPLSGPFCSGCGKKKTPKLTWSSLAKTAFQSFFSIDAPVWRTAISSLKDPGKVSNEYISGKGKRFLGPIQFVLGFALAGIIAESVGPLVHSQEWSLEAFQDVYPSVEVHQDFAILSIKDVPSDIREVNFIWSYENDEWPPESYENLRQKRGFVKGGESTSVIELESGEILEIVFVDLFPEKMLNEWGYFRRLSGEWSNVPLLNDLDAFVRRTESLRKSPVFSLVFSVPLIGLLLWFFSFSKRRPVLEICVFSAYWLASFGIVTIPFTLLFGELAFTKIELATPLLILTFWITFRGVGSFFGIFWTGCLWRVLLVIIFSTILIFMGLYISDPAGLQALLDT